MEGKVLLWTCVILLISYNTCQGNKRVALIKCSASIATCEDCEGVDEVCIDGTCLDKQLVEEEGVTSKSPCPPGHVCSSLGFCHVKHHKEKNSASCEDGCGVNEYCKNEVCVKKKERGLPCYSDIECETGVCRNEPTSQHEYSIERSGTPSSKTFARRNIRSLQELDRVHSEEHSSNTEVGYCRACVEDTECIDSHFCKNWDENDDSLTPCIPPYLYPQGCPQYTHGGHLHMKKCDAETAKRHQCKNVYQLTKYFPACIRKLQDGEKCPNGRPSVCSSGVCQCKNSVCKCTSS